MAAHGEPCIPNKLRARNIAFIKHVFLCSGEPTHVNAVSLKARECSAPLTNEDSEAPEMLVLRECSFLRTLCVHFM